MQTKKPRLALVSGVVAAAVVVVALGYALFAMFGDDDSTETASDEASASAPAEASGSPDPSTDESPQESAGAGQVTTLAFPAAGGRCLVPTADALGAKDIAFAGTVVSIDGEEATVETEDVYTGTVGDQVVVAMPGAAAFEGGFSLEEGKSYLLAADDTGTLTVCGFSGPASPQLQKLYDNAFS